MSVTVLYFASFQEAAQRDSEVIDKPVSLLALYETMKEKYRFPFQQSHIRVAVNGVFVHWLHQVNDADEIAFIPPVSGG
jgi:molybdopterin converting factor small subunit